MWTPSVPGPDHLVPKIIEVRGISMGVNVGSNHLRFLAPVRVGSHVRGSGTLVSAEAMADAAVQAVTRVTVELRGSDKPACIVETISRYFT
jgi:acyl dehydratase